MKILQKCLLCCLPVLTAVSMVGCGLVSIDVGEESIAVSQEESQRKMASLGETKGYEITLKLLTETTGTDEDDSSEASEVVFGMKGNTKWMLDEEGYGVAFVLEGSTYHYYENEDEGWSYVTSFEQNDDYNFAYLATSYEAYLLSGYAYDGMLNKGGQKTIAGRACTVYDYSINIFGNKIAYKIYADNELGITLKMDFGASNSEASAKISFEATSFKTDRDVVAPTLPAPELNDSPIAE